MKLRLSPILFLSAVFLFFLIPDLNGQPSDQTLPKTIQVFAASGNLTATRNYGYDSMNRIITIEDLPGDGVRNTFSDIRYNSAGKPVYVETFYSGVKEGADGITYFKNIQYSGNYISSIRLTSTSDEPSTSNYKYYSETRTYEAVLPGLPTLLFQFTPNMDLDRHYTAEGVPQYDVTYSTDPGLFADAEIPIELFLLFDGARHFFFSKSEVIALPVLNENSFDIYSTRDEQDRIQTIQARLPGTENNVFRLEVSY